MSKRIVGPDVLAPLADGEGLIAIAALRSAEITPTMQTRLVRSGVLDQLAPRLLTVAPASWQSQLAAALRIAGPASAAYGPTALALHGLADHEVPVHVVVPKGSRARDRAWVRFHPSELDRRVLANLTPRRVGIDDSVIDTVGMLDETAAIALLTRAIQERRTTANRLLTVVAQRRRVSHRDVVLSVLRDGAGIESALEWAYVAGVEKPHGLEPMQRQYVVPETGHRADGAYVDRRTLIHLDGARYHDRAVDRDLDNRHAAVGYATFRFTWADCWVTPCATASRVAGGEPPRRCPKCP